MSVAGAGFEQCYHVQAEQRLAAAGYFSEANVTACDNGGIALAIAITRDPPAVSMNPNDG
jgi:hypothetical protein